MLHNMYSFNSWYDYLFFIIFFNESSKDRKNILLPYFPCCRFSFLLRSAANIIEKQVLLLFLLHFSFHRLVLSKLFKICLVLRQRMENRK